MQGSVLDEVSMHEGFAVHLPLRRDFGGSQEPVTEIVSRVWEPLYPRNSLTTLGLVSPTFSPSDHQP